MKFIKGLVLGLLSFSLFLSLTVFSTLFIFKSTLLNPDFMVAQTDKIPISALAREMMKGQFSAQLPVGVSLPEETIYQVLSTQEPQLKEQMRNGIYSFYDFLLRKSEKFNVTISLESLKETLRDSLWQAFKQNLPPQLAGLPSNEVEQYFNDFYQKFTEQVPSEFKLDETQIPPEIMVQIMQVRQYMSYIPLAYYGSIVLMLLLILGIIALSPDVKGAARGLGINFLIYGVLEYAGVLVTRYLAPTYLPAANIPIYPTVAHGVG